MSDLRSLTGFSFGDVETYIKLKLDKICGGATASHMKNFMVHQKSFALHSEEGHIFRIVIKCEHNQFCANNSSIQTYSFQLIDDSDYFEGDYASHSDIFRKQDKNGGENVDKDNDDKLFYPTRSSKILLSEIQ
ncbi:unnamed protein product [Didymodactylos carnosus]|uniref:Uncharacterized protein n=1 Tax=Didymodactylos carnosus TaxID=1234261 RepID=A0A816D026_9BILA|nr:unnamed protein product [Didymodactylos carnosus]CAF1628316.1 unnamed protein product [Didymodactylos carnosus]CAF4021820.1 unnamed protein product [Didymodactylos carnosus]CAF4524798.1 unnamed protein product [Didymodactylos carnosus]